MTVHVLAGVVALLAALGALATAKGGALHRGSGRVYVGAMVVMAATAAAMAAFIPERIFVVAGGLTLYLVVTGLLTVRPPPLQDESIHWVALGVGAGVALLAFTFGAEALSHKDGRLDGFPAWLYLLVGLVAAVGALADLYMLKLRAPVGRVRIMRHLWRMLAALVVTTAAFFLGQSQVFPELIRHWALLSLPALTSLALLIYWLVWAWLRGPQDP